MTKEEIINIVKKFLLTEPITFSHHWEDELVKRLMFIRNRNINIYVGQVHGDMLNEIVDKCKWFLLSDFPRANAEDIVQAAYLKWRKSNFDGTISTKSTNPEFDALMQFTEWENIDNHRAESKMEKIRYDEGGYDKQDEDDEEDTSSDSFLQDIDEVPAENDGIDDGFEPEEIFYEDESAENIPGEVIDQLPSENETHEKKNEITTIYLEDKRFAIIAASEAEKFYQITKRKITKRRFQPSRVNQSYKPVKKTIEDLTRIEFHHLKKSTLYYKDRFNILKNGKQRKWMEIAISEMKKSKIKLDAHISYIKANNSEFDELEYRRQKPILSAVALDKDGNKIATCFKGEVKRIENERDLTFDLHCEYALFAEVIGNESMPSLKGGTMYVTLEPCNKRGYYLDGEKKKPKIPCAVRCVESGIETIYIGSLDDNEQVYKKGDAILRTGKYSFNLVNGLHVGNEKEKKASELLEAYFRDEREYPFEKFADRIVYTIGNPVTVNYFDSDLTEEVRNINSYFLRKHNPTDFR